MRRVDAGGARVGQRARQSCNSANRPDPGIQFQAHPDVQLGGDLSAVRVADARQPHGAEQNRIGVFQRLHGLIGKRNPGVSISPGASGIMPPDEREPAHFRSQRLEHLQGGRRHLDADSVSGEHRNLKCARSRHAGFVLASSASAPVDVRRPGTERGNRIPFQAAEINRLQVATAEGQARDILQKTPAACVHVDTPHGAGQEGLLAPVDMGLVRIFEDELLGPVRRYANDAVAHDARNPDPACTIKGKAVREVPFPKVVTVCRSPSAPSAAMRNRASRRPKVSLT